MHVIVTKVVPDALTGDLQGKVVPSEIIMGHCVLLEVATTSSIAANETDP